MGRAELGALEALEHHRQHDGDDGDGHRRFCEGEAGAGRRGGSQGLLTGSLRRPEPLDEHVTVELEGPVRAMISMVKKFSYAGCFRTTWWSEAAPRGSKRAQTEPES